MKKTIAALSLCLMMAMSVFAVNVTATEINDPVAATESTLPAVTVSYDEAISIALNDAGYTDAQVKYLRVTDWYEEDGSYSYKIIFYIGPVEFGYHISGSTGDILFKEIGD